MQGLTWGLRDHQHRGSGIWSRSLGFHSALAFRKAYVSLKEPVGNAAGASE